MIVGIFTALFKLISKFYYYGFKLFYFVLYKLNFKVDKEKNTVSLDITDIKLLELLQLNSKQTIKELAAKLNLSQTPVHERIKRLEQSGVIRRFVALLDLEKAGKPVITYCNVSLVKHMPKAFADFNEQVKDIKEVIEWNEMQIGP